MNLLVTILLVVQMMAALFMVGLILMQHGKGADMGAAFGSGSAGSLFGSSGSANFLSRSTAVLATIFFVATLTLAYFGKPAASTQGSGSVLDRGSVTLPQPAADTASQIPDTLPQQAAPAAGTAVGEIPGQPVEEAPPAAEEEAAPAAAEVSPAEAAADTEQQPQASPEAPAAQAAEKTPEN